VAESQFPLEDPHLPREGMLGFPLPLLIGRGVNRACSASSPYPDRERDQSADAFLPEAANRVGAMRVVFD
jgi:hypothetical protein